MQEMYDVAIVGGGPAGATVGALLKKYRPDLSVAIFERETFPRDHVGESHLPAISRILEEMGVWDKVEAANFPIKVGATFKWGVKGDLWNTDFLDGREFKNEPRPAAFAGQRLKTAFQVDRSIYDKILLDHAGSLGCEVHEDTGVREVLRTGDRIDGLTLENGRGVTARWYVDATGDVGLIRRAMGIETEAPTALRNIAFWKYWKNAEWAVTLGTGGTRIQIMSLNWGWLWFIPITPTRTSIGLVLPAAYYKASGKKPGELYEEALASEPLLSNLVANAVPEEDIFGTKDWNFLALRMTGENWFLSGDACGFADPILSAGMTLAHVGARKVAYTILELEQGELDAEWLKRQFSEGHRDQIKHHMQFADFWYSSNQGFTELKDYCAEIAEHAGLTLRPEQAFQWLATGGFAIEEPGVAAALTYRFAGLKALAENLGGAPSPWEVSKTNFWRLNSEGVVQDTFPSYRNGRVVPIPCLRRGPKLLPVADVFRHLLNALSRNMDSIMILEDTVNSMIREDNIPGNEGALLAVEGLEVMLLEGWIKGKAVPSRPFIKVKDES